MKSKQNLFPALYEICSAGAVGVSALRGLGLDREARGFQAEMHADFSGIETAPGIILPWDQSSYGPAREAREARDMTAGTAGEGGNTIGTAIPEIGAALRANLVLEKLGARVLGGLTENICLPAAGASVAAAWRSETADEPETDTTFARLDLSPKRITAFIDVSDRLLRQQGAIEAFLVTELMDAMAVEWQRVAIAGTGASNEPRGLLSTVGISDVAGGTNGLAPTQAHLAALEFAVTGPGKADRGHLGWLASPAARRRLRTTPIFASGSLPIWSEADALLGRIAGTTPSVPDNLTKGSSSGVCSAIVFGEMSELFLAAFGPGIVVNAVRAKADAIAGRTRLYASMYVDCGVRNPAAFAAMLDALCA